MKGILVNYEYCTGCHSCEVACKKHLGLPAGEFGIKVAEIGPFEYEGAKNNKDRWEWTWMPVLTKACDMCEDRVAKGKMPMCVQHCQAWCLYHGEVDELPARSTARPGARFWFRRRASFRQLKKSGKRGMRLRRSKAWIIPRFLCRRRILHLIFEDRKPCPMKVPANGNRIRATRRKRVRKGGDMIKERGGRPTFLVSVSQSVRER